MAHCCYQANNAKWGQWYSDTFLFYSRGSILFWVFTVALCWTVWNKQRRPSMTHLVPACDKVPQLPPPVVAAAPHAVKEQQQGLLLEHENIVTFVNNPPKSLSFIFQKIRKELSSSHLAQDLGRNEKGNSRTLQP